MPKVKFAQRLLSEDQVVLTLHRRTVQVIRDLLSSELTWSLEEGEASTYSKREEILMGRDLVRIGKVLNHG